jgi:hypothetical protein
LARRILPSRCRPVLYRLVGLIAVGVLSILLPSTGSTQPESASSPAWLPISTNNSPDSRGGHSLVWSGTELLMSGGQTGRQYFFTGARGGGRYDPITDRWRPMTQDGEPSPRTEHVAVWTGQEMLIWGGYPSPPGSATRPSPLLNGSLYDPVADRWRPVSSTGAPQGQNPTGLWTGRELLVYSLVAGQFDGARYDPAVDRWTRCPGSVHPRSTISTAHLPLAWHGPGASWWCGEDLRRSESCLPWDHSAWAHRRASFHRRPLVPSGRYTTRRLIGGVQWPRPTI